MAELGRSEDVVTLTTELLALQPEREVAPDDLAWARLLLARERHGMGEDAQVVRAQVDDAIDDLCRYDEIERLRRAEAWRRALRAQ